MDCFALTRRRRPLVWQHEYSMGLGHVRRHARRGVERTSHAPPHTTCQSVRLDTRRRHNGRHCVVHCPGPLTPPRSERNQPNSGLHGGFRTNFGYTHALHTRMGEPQSGYAHQNVTSDKASQRSSYASSVNDQSSLIVMTSFESTSKADHSSIVVGTPSLAKSLQSC